MRLCSTRETHKKSTWHVKRQPCQVWGRRVANLGEDGCQNSWRMITLTQCLRNCKIFTVLCSMIANVFIKRVNLLLCCSQGCGRVLGKNWGDLGRRREETQILQLKTFIWWVNLLPNSWFTLDIFRLNIVYLALQKKHMHVPCGLLHLKLNFRCT